MISEAVVEISEEEDAVISEALAVDEEALIAAEEAEGGADSNLADAESSGADAEEAGTGIGIGRPPSGADAAGLVTTAGHLATNDTTLASAGPRHRLR